MTSRGVEQALSSDEWSSSSSSSENDANEDGGVKHSPVQHSTNDSSSSETESDDYKDDSGLNTKSKRKSDKSSEEDDEEEEASDDDSSEGAVESDNDTNLTMGERLSRREQRTSKVILQRAKERKAKARQLIAERMSKFKSATISDDANDAEEEETQQPTNQNGKKKKKRSKHAPTEASSKRKDFYSRRRNLNESGIGVAIGAHRYKPRDPRMSSLSGHLNEEHFERNYAFVNGVREEEMEQLKKRIEARKMTGTKGNRKRRKLGLTFGQGTLEEDVQKLRHLQQQKADMDRKQMERNAKRSVKKRLQEEVVSGQRSSKHFLKRREMKHLYTEAKFEEIRKRGGDAAVDRAMSKRRKKNKARDARGFGSHNNS